jgi:dTDP-4-dehydrorhamnose 3,5-epimerase
LSKHNASWRLTPTAISGCFEIHFPIHGDLRGNFVKTFQASKFESKGFETDFAEMFYTVSGENVLRGMHLQLPPADHAKLVYVVEGSVADVVLDLRRGSPAYGKHVLIELSAEACNGVYLPHGVAHGFYVKKAPAILVYQVTTEHAPDLEAGIAWNSFGANWPNKAPIISPRDQALPALAEFDSPFMYKGNSE